ncbi:IclR family transcriptional regulator [Embleya sp. NBC_00896]|uniref:IclR family transcriptional regulator n=1 Tax=Embleya sp. NBC_00896 TaxID=2975961 RepID=UPI002F91403A|nr:IclR family transcriptional regulator [Embleya sp. NBC_00896]
MAVGRLGTVEKAMRVLTAISERQPVTVTGLARALDIDKSAVQRTVVTLRDAGWLRQDPASSAWSLDAQALVVGRRFAGGLLDRARPHLEALARSTGETVTLWVVRGPSFVAVDSVDSEHALRIVVPVGLHAPLSTGAGAAAFLDADAQKFLGDDLPAPAELDAIRSRGYYLTTGGSPGTIAIGAPVYPPQAGTAALGTVLITAPTSRVTPSELRARAPELLRTAAAISGRFAGS